MEQTTAGAPHDLPVKAEGLKRLGPGSMIGHVYIHTIYTKHSYMIYVTIFM